VTQNYYIYYRSLASDDQVRDAVRAMQTTLARAVGVQGRLLRRQDGSTTWMEIYENISDSEQFERQLDAAVEHFGLRSLLSPDSERHVERFVEA
jgi:hypothetical protein